MAVVVPAVAEPAPPVLALEEAAPFESAVGMVPMKLLMMLKLLLMTLPLLRMF